MDKVDIVSNIEFENLPNRTTASDSLTVQPDLLYMKSVLVSAGWNDNDDVFLPNELWRARTTPKLKPVDWEHNTGHELLDNAQGTLKDPKKIVQDNQIVGVMHNAYAADSSGPIDDTKDGFTIPNKFNVINEAVIFKYLFPKTAARIVKEAQDNKLFVSMEAWFSNYDYMVGNKVVARNEQTFFLDKCLKVRGGDGKFGGQRVGRVLRNITFGGIGLVSRPANKDSIIESFTNASQEEIKGMEVENKAAEEAIKVVEAALKAKEAELAAANKKIEEMHAGLEAIESRVAKGSECLVKATAIDAKSTDIFADVAKAYTELKEKSAKTAAELEAASAKLAEIEAQKVYASRLATITSELNLSATASDTDELNSKKVAKAEKLAKLVAKYSEEAFASWLAEIKEVVTLTSAAMPPWMKDKKDKEAKDKEEDKKDKTGKAAMPCPDCGKTPCDCPAADKTKSSASLEITDPKVLENVKAEAPMPAGKDNAGNVVKLSDKMKSLAAELLSAAKK